MSEATRVGPVLPHERIQLLDVLRGFALFGILQTNFSDWDGALTYIIEFFIDGSFYTTFSFLFGLGFAIQLIRAEDRKAPFAARYLWRSVLLLLIGVVHAVFIWQGDILRDYGLVAILLLVVHRARNKVLLALAAALLLFTVVPFYAPAGALLSRPPVEAAARGRVSLLTEQMHRQSVGAMSSQGRVDGEYLNLVRGRAQFTWSTISTFGPWLGGWRVSIFCMFIFGLVFGRKRILHEPAKHRTLLLGIMVVGLLVGVVGNAFDTFPEFLSGHGIHLPAALASWEVNYYLGNIGLAFFYVTSLTLLFTYREGVRRFLAPLALVGRMGLTNYLMQSVVMVLLLNRPGFNLEDTLVGWNQQLVLVAFFAVQMLYSAWWFRRFQFGPVEWCWRSLTWFRVPPMRRAPVAESAAAA